jgi:hypothetical protein
MMEMLNISISIDAAFDVVLTPLCRTTHWQGTPNPGTILVSIPLESEKRASRGSRNKKNGITIASGSISATVETSSDNFKTSFNATDGT